MDAIMSETSQSDSVVAYNEGSKKMLPMFDPDVRELTLVVPKTERASESVPVVEIRESVSIERSAIRERLQSVSKKKLFSPQMLKFLGLCSSLRTDAMNQEFVMKAIIFLFENPQWRIILDVVGTLETINIHIAFSPVSNDEKFKYETERIYANATSFIDDDDVEGFAKGLLYPLYLYAMDVTYKNDKKPYFKQYEQFYIDYLRDKDEEQFFIEVNIPFMKQQLPNIRKSETQKLREKIDELRVKGLMDAKKITEFEMIIKNYEQHVFDYANQINNTKEKRLIQLQILRENPNTKFNDEKQCRNYEKELEAKDVSFDRYVAQVADTIYEFEKMKIVLENAWLTADEKLRKTQKDLKETKFISTYKTYIIWIVLAIATASLYKYWTQPNINDFEWRALSEDQKIQLENTEIVYKGMLVKFGELFSKDSNIYNLLSPDHIKNALEGDTQPIENGMETLYGPYIFFAWHNMTEDMKVNLLTRCVDYQGINLPLNQVVEANSEILDKLLCEDIRKLFNNETVNFFAPLKDSNHFFIERLLIGPGKALKTMNQLTDEAKKYLLFILSDRAGEGKTITLQNLWHVLKEKFPKRLVLFIDLKKYNQQFKSCTWKERSCLKNTALFLAIEILHLRGIELELFLEKYKENNVAFLFDAVDELQEKSRENFMDMVLVMRKQTRNFCIVSTRPQHSNTLQAHFPEAPIYSFKKLNKVERNEFILKFAVTKNRSDKEKIQKYLELIDNNLINEIVDSNDLSELLQKTFKCTESLATELSSVIDQSRQIFQRIRESSNNAIDNPLFIKLIVDISLESKLRDVMLESIFQIFLEFLQKSIKFANDKYDEPQHYNKLNDIMKAHQAYAIGSIFKLDEDSLDINDYKLNITKEDISRSGVLVVFAKNDYEFIHRTFAEALVAQYLVENISKVDRKSTDTKTRLKILCDVLFTNEHGMIKDFMILVLLEESQKKNFEISLNVQGRSSSNDVAEMKSENIVNLLRYLELYVYFAEKSVKLNSFLNQNIFKLTTGETNTLINNGILEPNFFKSFYDVEDFDGKTFLHYLIETSSGDAQVQLLEKIVQKFCNNDDIIDILSIKNDAPNYLANLALTKSSDDLEALLNFIAENSINEYTKMIHYKILALFNPKSGTTPLHMAMKNSDVQSFRVIAKFYETYMDNFINDILTGGSEGDEQKFSHDAITGNNDLRNDVIEFIQKYQA